jgi:hypothetical protein
MELLALDLELALLFLYMHLYPPPELLAPILLDLYLEMEGMLAMDLHH